MTSKSTVRELREFTRIISKNVFVNIDFICINNVILLIRVNSCYARTVGEAFINKTLFTKIIEVKSHEYKRKEEEVM